MLGGWNHRKMRESGGGVIVHVLRVFFSLASDGRGAH